MNRLARWFDVLERATEPAAAAPALQAILGIRAPNDGMPAKDEPPRVPMLRYDRPRRIDLLALRAGARAVAKFEDLALDRAIALQRTLEKDGFVTERVGPYDKRFDVTLASAIDGGSALHTIIASRGTLAAEIAEAERDRSAAGTRRAGELLGYPACCIERFVEVSASPAADDDGVNEAAVRASLGDGRVAWQLNPLSVSSPVGFSVCSPHCSLALQFARRVLDVLDGESLAVVERTLRRPVLFFRLSAFFVLDGAPTDRGARYARAWLNGAGAPTTIERWAHHLVGPSLAHRSEIALEDLDIVDREIPRLFRFE